MKNILPIFCFFITVVLYAQEPVPINLTSKDGLPDMRIYDLEEDEHGFIWLAANNGLYRYDGKNYKLYSNPQKRGLSVFNLQKDSKNRIWCNNLSGQFFYVENDSLCLFTNVFKEFQLPEKLYDYLLYDTKLVVFGNGKLLAVSLADKKRLIQVDKSKYYQEANVLNDTLFVLGLEKEKGTYSKYSAFFYTKESSILKKKQNCKSIALENQHFTGSFVADNKLYFTGNRPKVESILKLEHESLKFIKTAKEIHNENKIKTNFINNEAWMLTKKGVFVNDIKNDSLILKRRLFKNKIITDVLIDKNGSYWFSSIYNGIYVYPNINLKKHKSFQGIGTISKLIKLNNNTVAFGTIKGDVVVYNVKKGSYKKIVLPIKSLVTEMFYNNTTKDLYISLENSFFSFTYNLKSEELYRNKDTFIGAKDTEFLSKDTLISVRGEGIHFSKINNHKLEPIVSSNLTLPSTRMTSIHEDIYTGEYYVSTIDGILVFDKFLKKRTPIKYKGNAINSFQIAQTDDGCIWITYNTNGILKVKDKKVVKQYTTKNGLLSNNVKLIESDRNKLWIVTNKGLQYFNSEQETFSNLNSKEGVESSKISGLKVLGNNVFYTSGAALFSFDKTKVFKTDKPRKPYFTSVTIADSIYSLRSNYVIQPDKKRIKISFNSTGFQSHKYANYEYRLLGGYSDTWSPISGGVNNVEFSELGKGNYTFELRTFNNGFKSDSSKLKFTVGEHFYKELWFVVVVSGLGVLLVVAYYKRHFERKQKAQQLEYELKTSELEKNILKLESLQSQMNPHFVFNALKSVKDYVLNNEKDLAGDYLTKFTNLVRLYLNQGTKKRVSLVEEIDTLKRYLELEKLRFGDKLDYVVLVDKESNAKEVYLPTMLIQPYVESALKESLLHKKDKGSLVISFSTNKVKDYLTCVVIDDGVGRKKSNQIKKRGVMTFSSFATKATEDRLELLNYNQERKIKVSTEDLVRETEGEDTGTKVTISIPV